MKRTHAFTLIEMLVVISVISLLVAILLPALAAAREAGKSIQCAANTRQIMLAFALYGNDWKGRQPVIQGTSSTWVNPSGALGYAGEDSWPYQISPYLRLDWSGDTNRRYPTSGPPILLCPSANAISWGARASLSYGYNRDLWWWQDKNVAHPKMDTFKRPTQILMVADFWHNGTREPVRPDPKPWNFPGSHHGGSASTTSSHTHEGGGLGGTYGSFAFRHTQQLNMGYADGHVRASSRRPDNRPTQHRFLDTSTFWE